MTDNQSQDDSQDTVLLSYRLQTKQRVLALAAAVLFLSISAISLKEVILHLIDRSQGGDWQFSILLLLFSPHVFLRLIWTAVAITCTTQGITIRAALRNRFIPWELVCCLKREKDLSSRFDNMDLAWLRAGRQHYFLYIDRHTRAQLVSLLREASNARIVGFDDGS